MATQAELILRIWNRDGDLPDDLPDAFQPHAEHVAAMLEQGFVCGEIVDEAFSGWWEIQEREA